MAATQGARVMFGELAQATQPRPAQASLFEALRHALEEGDGSSHMSPAPVVTPMAAPVPPPANAGTAAEPIGRRCMT